MKSFYQTIDVKELYGYINEIHGGYIRANYHPEDNNIVILNYTELATFERHWNKYTKSARGLILDLTDVKDNGIVYILAKPFEKFPNYGEDLEYEKDIDWNEIETVMEKMDGSLGISYIFKGEMRFATRGSFNSDQALRATEMWHNQYKEANEKYIKRFEANGKYIKHFEALPAHNLTLLVEIIYPENRVVVDYKGEEKLVLLGITKNGHDSLYNEVLEIGNYLGIPVVPQYEYTLEDMLRMKKEISANEEGWIVRFKNGKRLKIKGDEYIQVHRIMHGLSDKAKVKAWSEGRMSEYIMMLPEEFRPELEAFNEQLNSLMSAEKTILNFLLLQAKETTDNKKDFAIHINSIVSPEYRKFMFNAYNRDEVSEELLREHVSKNYNTYLEVINLWKIANNDL